MAYFVPLTRHVLYVQSFSIETSPCAPSLSFSLVSLIIFVFGVSLCDVLFSRSSHFPRPPFVVLFPACLSCQVTARDIHEAYDFTGPVLGKGAFATVLRVRDRMSGSEYAVKQARVFVSVELYSQLRLKAEAAGTPGKYCMRP